MLVSIVAGFMSFVAVMICVAVNSFGYPVDN